MLDEIVYDVESCEHACELERLIRKVSMAERSLVEYRERENDLIQERQQVNRCFCDKMGEDLNQLMHISKLRCRHTSMPSRSNKKEE